MSQRESSAGTLQRLGPVRLGDFGKINDSLHRRNRLLIWALLVLASAGVSLRSLEFWRNHSLMLDECAVCMNVADRGLAGLTKPLDYDQAAPPAYLLLQKAVFVTLGMNDRTVRILPLLFGLATIPLAVLLAIRVFPPESAPTGVVLTVGLIAINRGLSIYSGISKQYTLECVSTLLLLLALFAVLGLGDAPPHRARTPWLLVFLPLLVWFSYGAVFVIAGIGVALAARALVTRQRNALVLAAGFGLCALPNFLLLFQLSARGTMSNKRLSDLWVDGYMPAWPPVQTLQWLYHASIGAGESSIHLRLALLLPVALIVTAGYAVRRRSWFWLAGAATILFCLAASALHRYPFSGRLLLFLLPVFVLMLAQAVYLLGKYSQLSGVAVTIVLLAVAAAPAVGQLVLRDSSIDQVRVVHKALLGAVVPHDQIWIAPYSVPCLRYYSREYPFPEGVDMHILSADEEPALAHGRNWLVVMRTPWSPGEGERLLESAARKGVAGTSFDVELTTARLFNVP